MSMNTKNELIVIIIMSKLPRESVGVSTQDSSQLFIISPSQFVTLHASTEKFLGLFRYRKKVGTQKGITP